MDHHIPIGMLAVGGGHGNRLRQAVSTTILSGHGLGTAKSGGEFKTSNPGTSEVGGAIGSFLAEKGSS
jgi:hypothetical protein